MIIHKELMQGSEKWIKTRLGKITGSMVHHIMANGRGGKPSVASRTYMIQLLAERITGLPAEFYKSKDMQWGNDTEPKARALYEFNEGVDVQEIGFFELNEWIGYSPDGVVGDDGLIEIKCPKSTTQLTRWVDGIELPEEYKPQVQFGLWVTGRHWCDFISYDPRIKGKADYMVYRIYRDEKYLEEMENRIWEFVRKLRALINSHE